MRKSRILSAAVLFAMSITLAGVCAAQEAKSPEEQKMMDMMAKYGQPGEQHQVLQTCVGKWDLTARWWMEPGSEPQESKATSEFKPVLGGRFFQENVSGEMDGSPFHGLGITGYDNFKGKYFSFWIDEMGTSYLLTEGTADPTGKVITMEGQYDDFMTGEKGKSMKTVMRMIDNDHQVYEMYIPGKDGKMWKSFEVDYTRAK